MKQVKRLLVGVGLFLAGYLLTAIILIGFEMVLVMATGMDLPTAVTGILALAGGLLFMSKTAVRRGDESRMGKSNRRPGER